MEVIVTIGTLVLIERALCVGLYNSDYDDTQYLWLDILYRAFKFIGAFSVMLLIGIGWWAFLFIWGGYLLAFILRALVYKWKSNVEHL